MRACNGGSTEIDVPSGAVLHCFSIYASEAQSHYWVIFAEAEAATALDAALQHAQFRGLSRSTFAHEGDHRRAVSGAYRGERADAGKCAGDVRENAGEDAL